MLINRWLIVDSIPKAGLPGDPAGFCISLNSIIAGSGQLLKALQEGFWQVPLTILLPADSSPEREKFESLAETMIRFFFQPQYYTSDFSPVVFVAESNPSISDFLSFLHQKCTEQGLKEMEILNFRHSGPALVSLITSKGTDLNLLTDLWQKKYISSEEPSEIHLLIPAQGHQQAILDDLTISEKKLKTTEAYSITSFLYARQREIEEYRHQLYLKTVSEKNTQLYLSLQKEERANGLKWYYNEYEILPGWYKKFGHILKVMMGKRTLKSLFSDKVKKYKD